MTSYFKGWLARLTGLGVFKSNDGTSSAAVFSWSPHITCRAQNAMPRKPFRIWILRRCSISFHIFGLTFTSDLLSNFTHRWEYLPISFRSKCYSFFRLSMKGNFAVDLMWRFGKKKNSKLQALFITCDSMADHPKFKSMLQILSDTELMLAPH